MIKTRIIAIGVVAGLSLTAAACGGSTTGSHAVKDGTTSVPTTTGSIAPAPTTVTAPPTTTPVTPTTAPAPTINSAALDQWGAGLGSAGTAVTTVTGAMSSPQGDS